MNKTSFGTIGKALAACIVLTHLDAMAITRHYEAHCLAPDGSKFILRAAYDYMPLPLPSGHNSAVSMKSDWKIFYQPLKRGSRRSEAPGAIQFSGPDTMPCEELGVLDGVAVVRMSYLRADGSWFPREHIPAKSTLSATPSELPAAQRQEVEAMGVRPAFLFGLVVPRNGRLVYEQPLLTYVEKPSGRVKAVYQSVSRDDGKTWSEPVITSNAENFEIGKLLTAQRYAARLVPGGTAGKNQRKR
ncbi:MAG: hypothetical protein V4631_10075 [Pseudomonadota bacterium]